MKILWVSASPVGPASRILNKEYKGTSGVWIQNIYTQIRLKSGNEMYFLCFSKSLKKNRIIHKKTDEGEAYCVNMPEVSFGRQASFSLKRNVESVIDNIHPDIIHIWGTETVVQNVVAECAPGVPKVVFLQGIIGIHSRYIGGYLKSMGYKINYNLREFLIRRAKNRNFKKQALYEAKQLKLCSNVIIDNEFSACYCRSISDQINLYYYKLVPGNVFFEKKWKYSSDIPHTIFTVFGSTADKGIHQILRALKLIKQIYPDVKLIIPGPFNITDDFHLKEKNNLTAYEKLLFEMIDKFDLFDNVCFCGKLTQDQMAETMTRSTVFVNSSIMEVHAGSLREAMACGMPCVSSYCGSVSEFVKEGYNGFIYRYEEFEVLAYKLIKLFSDEKMMTAVGKNAAETIEEMRKAQGSIIDIYSSIIYKQKENHR